MALAKTMRKVIDQIKEKQSAQADEVISTRGPSVGSRLASRMRSQDLTVDDRRPRQSTRFRSRARDGSSND